MSVTLTVEFTGLFLFVPSRDEEIVSVYTPDATRSFRALDGNEVERHVLRVIHRPSGADVELCRYHVQMPNGLLRLPDSRTADADRDSVRNRAGLLDLGEVAPDYRIRRPRPGEPDHPMVGRIELRSGALDGLDVAENWLWTIEPSLPGGGGSGGERPYAWKVSWKMDLPRVPDLYLDPDPHGAGECQPTNLRDLDPPEIEIWHVPPRHLPSSNASGSGLGEHIGPDRPAHSDFRAFYEFLRDKDELRRHLPEEGLPIPRTSRSVAVAEIKKILDDSPVTHDCLPAVGEEEDDGGA